MARGTQIKLARAAAAGLALVAAAALAGPGWGHEKECEEKQEQQRAESKADKQPDRQEREQHRHIDRHSPAARIIKAISRELDLSRDQRRSLRELVLQHADELRAAAREIGDARRALRETAFADTLDEAAIRGASGRLGSAIGSATLLSARIADGVRPALTPRQRERLRQIGPRWQGRREPAEHWDRD